MKKTVLSTKADVYFQKIWGSFTHYTAKTCLLPLMFSIFYPKVVLLLRLSTALQSHYYTLGMLIKTCSHSAEVHIQKVVLIIFPYYLSVVSQMTLIVPIYT